MDLSNGDEVLPALHKARENDDPFDLCISDIQMPGMSGFKIAKQIRDPKYHFQNLRLIALSSVMDRDAQECEDAGFDGFLSKPIHREKLFRMLERILGEKEVKGYRREPTAPKIMTQYRVREDMKRSVRILLAEDNPVNKKLAKLMLTKAGYQVEIVNNGREAVEKFTTSPKDFDLIFMDVQMPEMDGMEATKAIRSHEKQLRVTDYELQEGNGITGEIRPATRNPQPATRCIPIVAMTAHAMKGDREKCLEAGMDDYVQKPIKREAVFEVVKKWIFDRQGF